MLSIRWDLSLNCVIRSNSPSGATLLKIHWSRVCSGTCDWTKTMARSGSIPAASSPMAMSRVRAASSRGSKGMVSTCRSTTQ
jgi:hypothetical protein